MDKHTGRADAWTAVTLEDAVRGWPTDAVPHAQTVLADADAVRALSVLGQGRLVSARHRVVVERFRAPLAGWRGRLGHLPGLREHTVVWPRRRTGRVSVDVVLAAPVDVATVAAAVAPMLWPASTTEHVGSPLVTLAPSAPRASLALLETPWATPEQHERDPAALLGNDVVLVGTDDDAAHETPRTVVVDVEGRPAGTRRPVVDLAVHNPVRRLAKVDGAVPWRAGTLLAHDDVWDVVVDGRAHASFDPARPVGLGTVELLRSVASLDLGRLAVPDGGPDARATAARVVELAATGVVLHGARPLAGALTDVAPELVEAVVRPHAPAHGLPTLAAAVAQRRVAMRAHAGRYALSGSLTGGAPALPHVSVLLVTNRPGLVEPFLASVAAQTYPHLDVVVVLHGVPAPDTSRWDPRLRELVSTTLEVAAATPFGDVLARATAAASGPLVVKMDDDDLYGPEFVWDLVLARAFSGAQVVGKQAELTYLEPFEVTVRRGFTVEDYSEQVAGGTMLASVADVMAVGGWRGVPRSVDRALMQRVVKAGGLMYVDRGVGFVYVRHGRGHTWNADASHFLRNVEEQWHGVHAPALGLPG